VSYELFPRTGYALRASRESSSRLALSPDASWPAWNFELNAFRPILISNYLHSALILADMCDHFRQFMVEGTKLNQATLTANIDRSVMMVTALSPVIGYDKAAAISYYAIDHDLTLKQAALAKGVPEDLYDKVVKPIALTGPGTADVPAASRP
jgi:fumarate hydratase class II